MGARIFTMSQPQLAAAQAWSAPLHVAVDSFAAAAPGPYLVCRKKEETMSLNAEISVGPLVRGARLRRPSQETQAQAERIVADVRAEIARKPEFAAFADRPADDMRRPVQREVPVHPVGRMLRYMQASLRAADAR